MTPSRSDTTRRSTTRRRSALTPILAAVLTAAGLLTTACTSSATGDNATSPRNDATSSPSNPNAPTQNPSPAQRDPLIVISPQPGGPGGIPIPVPGDPRENEALRYATTLIGMSEQDAMRDIEENTSYDHRVISRDGIETPVTMDYSPDRINLVIRQGTITSVSVG